MHYRKAIGLLIPLLLVILIGAPGWLVYRDIRQDRLNHALIAAIKRDDTPAALSLLSQGADANTRDEPNVKPLPFWRLLDSLHGRHRPPSTAPTALLVMLEHRPIGPHNARIGDTIVIPSENTPLVKALLDHGACVNIEDSDGYTPLLLALGWDDYADTARLLVTHGADVNKPDAEGKTPLIYASAQHADLIPSLLDRWAKVNWRDKIGWTALMEAVYNQQLEAVRLLLDRGADVNIRGNTGETALFLARSNSASPTIIRLLKQAGAKE